MTVKVDQSAGARKRRRRGESWGRIRVRGRRVSGKRGGGAGVGSGV